jgi:hypothetical protein
MQSHDAVDLWYTVQPHREQSSAVLLGPDNWSFQGNVLRRLISLLVQFNSLQRCDLGAGVDHTTLLMHST